MLPIALPLPYPAPATFARFPHLGRRHILHFRSAAVLTSSAVAAAVDALRILEWDKVCEAVAAFAGTALGRDEAKSQLQQVVHVGYEDSQRLLLETAAAIEFIKHGASGLDFAGVDTALVSSAVDCVSRGSLLEGPQALAVVGLIQYVENLQTALKGAIKENSDWYNRFVPLSELILEASFNWSFVKSVQQVIDEDGSVKDNASSELMLYREKVRNLERKVFHLMDKLRRNDNSSLELCIVNGRCCIKVVGEQTLDFDGLLLSSSGFGNTIEPLAAVPLNDELLQARALVIKAEENVLSKLTLKMLPELENIKYLLQITLKLDVVAARAKFSIEFGGTFPELYLPEAGESNTENTDPLKLSHIPQRKWKLYMSEAFHPLLLQKHRERLLSARKDVANATSEIRRRAIYGRSIAEDEELVPDLESMKMRVSELETYRPTPVDFMVDEKIAVVVMTGPNTGGKTISLKTVGLASLMAKVGLFVLASEPVRIPWFDAVYADIGDEQSLAQSLSTFSGHLKQIGVIRANSTSRSLVLLDEVGAGTNPLEGAALGMSLLESFAKSGSFLTLATTHHGELKTLKYSDSSFENACVEFDEEELKPTFRILWGVPGRSNAINIAERLGLPPDILERARKLHGTASAEINEVIVDMEKSKQDFQRHLQQAQHYLMLSKKFYDSLLTAKMKIEEHKRSQRNRKERAISEYAVISRSILRNRMKQLRDIRNSEHAPETVGDNHNLQNPVDPPSTSSSSVESRPRFQEANIDERSRVPEIGEVVYVCTLNKQATVVNVEQSKGKVLVQAGNLKLKVRLEEVKSLQGRMHHR